MTRATLPTTEQFGTIFSVSNLRLLEADYFAPAEHR
jgi:hypothetical protein